MQANINHEDLQNIVEAGTYWRGNHDELTGGAGPTLQSSEIRI